MYTAPPFHRTLSGTPPLKPFVLGWGANAANFVAICPIEGAAAGRLSNKRGEGGAGTLIEMR